MLAPGREGYAGVEKAGRLYTGEKEEATGCAKCEMQSMYVKTAKVSFIPHIYHLDHPYIGGEILVIWRNFIFEYMTCVEEFLIFSHNRCREIINFAKF